MSNQIGDLPCGHSNPLPWTTEVNTYDEMPPDLMRENDVWYVWWLVGCEASIRVKWSFKFHHVNVT